MNPSIEAYKDLMLKSIAEGLRRERPGLTHARSFQLAQEQHPELAEEFPEPEQTTASTPYRYDPAKAPAVSQGKLDELLSRFGTKKVEARKPPRDDGELMLVMAADGTIDYLELR